MANLPINCHICPVGDRKSRQTDGRLNANDVVGQAADAVLICGGKAAFAV